MVDLDALEQALNAATPGDWTWEQKSYMGLYGREEYHALSAGCIRTECGMDADTEFIALAHNQMADLIAQFREARMALAQAPAAMDVGLWTAAREALRK